MKYYKGNLSDFGDSFSLADFEKEIKNAFKVISQSDIMIKHKQRSKVYSSSGVSYHTDAPMCDYIIWLCLTPGFKNEKLIIVDMEDFVSQSSSEEKEYMFRRNINVRKFPHLNSELLLSYEKYPILQIDHTKPKSENCIEHSIKSVNQLYENLKQSHIKFNYADWFSQLLPQNDSIHTIFDKIHDYCINNSQYIYLNKGDYLILNNGSMVHSRTALNPLSLRKHRRYLLTV